MPELRASAYRAAFNLTHRCGMSPPQRSKMTKNRRRDAGRAGSRTVDWPLSLCHFKIRYMGDVIVMAGTAGSLKKRNDDVEYSTSITPINESFFPMSKRVLLGSSPSPRLRERKQ